MSMSSQISGVVELTAKKTGILSKQLHDYRPTVAAWSTRRVILVQVLLLPEVSQRSPHAVE